MTDLQPGSDIARLVDEILAEYRAEPVDLLHNGHADLEYAYLVSKRFTYIRTVNDVLSYCRANRLNSANILEIGSFLGVVSIALAKLGFKVTASDIKEFMLNQNLQTKLKRYNVGFTASNLRQYSLPFDDEAYDIVIMCEVLEHLNFNPLPVVKEINRVMRPQGLFYLALPNIASNANRKNLLQGESIHNPIKDFFAQLDPTDNMIIGLHWREYTRDEIKEMLERMDFSVREQRYSDYGSGQAPLSPWKRTFKRVVKRPIRYVLNLRPIKRVIYSCWFDSDIDPTLKNGQVTFAQKERACLKQFHFTDATFPEHET